MATHQLSLMLLFLEVMATHRLSSLSLEAMATYQLPALFLESTDSNRRWQRWLSDHSKSRRHTRRSHPCHRRVPINNILSRWLHIGCLASHLYIFLLANSTCWPLSLLLFFTGQLNVLAYLIFAFFLLANSTCWPISFFYWPTQRVGLL